MSTHYLDEAEFLSDYIAILKSGNIIIIMKGSYMLREVPYK